VTELAARSTTLTSVGWIGYIIIGAIAGWIAGKIVKGGGSGILMNIVIGIVGALIGGTRRARPSVYTVIISAMVFSAFGLTGKQTVFRVIDR